jgi:hypothetical protein
LQRALKRGVLVIQTVPHHSQHRVARIAGEPGGFRYVADFDGGKNFFNPLGIAAHPTAEPPENALQDDRQRDNRDHQNRPHDRAAGLEVVNEEILVELSCGHGKGGRRG